MAGRPRKKKFVSQKIQQDAGTQTSPDKNEDKIRRMTEEINSLRRQLDRSKQIGDQNSIADNQRKAITVVAAADSPQEQPKIVVKGCNCRGKCSTRVCGCVKKQVPCGEFCKCQHARCQNKELDKENNMQAENVPSLRKPRKTVAEEAAGPSHKHLEQVVERGRGIFSPETSPRPRRGLPLRKMSYNETLEFTDKKKTLDFDSDSSSSPPNAKRKMKDSADKDSLKLPVQANGPSNSNERKNKRLLYYDGPKRRVDFVEPTGVETPQFPVRLDGKKGKAKKIKRAQMQVAASANENMEQLEVPQNSDAELELDVIDPMKPTRQLQRTPTSSSPRTNQRRMSQVTPFPRPEVKEEKEEHFLPLPKEIDEPLVNWEEHCAQLVPCKFCHRTFYPFRLQKHQASCKKV